MNNLGQVLEKLSRMPRPQRLGIYGGVLFLVVLVFYFLLISSAADSVAQLEAKQADLRKKIAEVEVHTVNRNLAKDRLNTLHESLKQAKRELPSSSEIPGLVKAISSTAKKSGLEVRKFQPLPEVRKEYVAEIPVALEVAGSYHEVAMFFDQLSRMSRIVYVRDITMSDPEDKGSKVFLTVSGKAVTFRFLTDEEKAAEAEKAKAKGKRGKGGG
jgi:type IV pilus assembly protein PilO